MRRVKDMTYPDREVPAVPLRFPQGRSRHLSVSGERHGTVLTITAAGHIDLATEAPWHERLMEAATSPEHTTHLVVDLTAVTHLSWASTAALVRAHHACVGRGRALHVRAGGAILTGLRLTRLDDTLTITPAAQVTRSVARYNCSEWLIA
ncbi:STAS domain-containing protein [Actinokineospora guangxiensis]|uniref:STAS domain-containing protein n=1 Tax=Actinokineospora guangxiensis TaxID=1490288 RepID=A0ABW0ELZ4_9PSEU